MLCTYLRKTLVPKQKADMKSQQTKTKLGVMTFAMHGQETDSGGQSDGKEEVDFEALLDQLIAETSRRTQINQRTESEDHEKKKNL